MEGVIVSSSQKCYKINHVVPILPYYIIQINIVRTAGNNYKKENEMDRCDVKLYSLSTCIHCRDEKDFLNQCSINYNCIDVDKLAPEQKKELLREIKEINPQCAFPTLVIGDKVIVGFKKDEIKEILGIK